jgi:hypothetical protein
MVSTALLKLARSGGRRKTKINFTPCHALSHTLCWAGTWRWGPIARTKKDRKQKKTPQASPHKARVVLGGVAQLRRPPQEKIIFAPCHALSLSLSLSLPHSLLWAGVWRWGPIARTKMDRKKNHTASPTSHSARGPAGVAQLGRPPQDKNSFCPLSRSVALSLSLSPSLSHFLLGWVWLWD